ncbi:hypothetical protein GUITHDRAFT_121824 [Guillardia theta CCMP2712]|uniref:Uncharacterized protein n=1 Tax=Guillardia theta (strain CCMP2712) TaxID=905079 RepID=L1I817_GUITC|nr:hypothetical protein GUITHDRAFT_121824 [Guillardia theta CCMP2712]EKX32005.1 hypothetical protein GUITHDRAFT_121824 [Guillardia theta CCMP2712]|eukprot:XP_005818985.1 hypothetical protein GUITHDRAFT_121824 [Guillardia theta CCMP2712]
MKRMRSQRGERELVLRATQLVSNEFKDVSEESYIQRGLREEKSMLCLQLKRMCYLAGTRWMIDGDREDLMSLLQFLYFFSDPSLPQRWQEAPAGTFRSMRGEILFSIVQEGRLYTSIRLLLLDPSWQDMDAAGSNQKPAGQFHLILSSLLWAIALHPLSHSSPPPGKQHAVAFEFAREILSIPQVLSKVPAMIQSSLTHHTVWPKLIYAIGNSEAASDSSGKQQQQQQQQQQRRQIGATAVAADRAMDLFTNVVEIANVRPIHGLQPLYLSALLRLVDKIPSSGWTMSKIQAQQLAPLHKPKHIHWLLLGLGGRGEGEEGKALEIGAELKIETLSLKSWSFVEWSKIYSDVRKLRNSDGKPKYTNEIVSFCQLYGKLLRLWTVANVQVLNAISFDSPVHVSLWSWLRCSNLLQGYIDEGTEAGIVGDVAFLFCKCYLHRLMVTDDTEFYEQQVRTWFPSL